MTDKHSEIHARGEKHLHGLEFLLPRVSNEFSAYQISIIKSMLSEFYDPIYEVIEAHEKKAKEEEHENALKEMADKKETNKAELFKYINIANNDKLLTENTSSSSSQQQQQQKEEKYGPGPSEKRNSMAGKSDNATHSMDGSDSSNENKDNVSTDNSNSNDTDAAPNNKVLHLRNPALIEALKEVMTGYLERTWDQLFSECPTSMGKRLSKGERTSLGLVRSSLVYGEIQFKSFATVFWGPHINLLPGGAFYDLGSGTGRAVFAACLLHDFTKCTGIEILEGLHNASSAVLRKYTESVLPHAGDVQKAQQLDFVHSSFLDYDWSDASLIFANSTCFDVRLMTDIAKKGANECKDGCFVITFTKSLDSPYFEKIDSTQYTMTWGFATVHVHRKITPVNLQPAK